MTWTAEQDHQLATLWANPDMSASDIAVEVGAVSRNAVIGRAHRLGLPARKKPGCNAGTATRKRRPSPSKPPRPASLQNVFESTAAIPNLPPDIRKAIPDEIPDIAGIPASPTLISLFDLRGCMCRWPIGDPRRPEFRFCGRRTGAADEMYCGAHMAKAYQPASSTRRGSFKLEHLGAR